MAEQKTIKKDTIIAVVNETIEGTPAVDGANDVVRVNMDGLEFPDFSRDQVDADYIDGSYGKDAPIFTTYGDITTTLPLMLRGSGTRLTASDDDALLITALGEKRIGVDGTIKATPTPTTSTWTVEGGPTIAQNDLLLVDVAGTFEYCRAISVSGSPDIAVTCWPPLSAIPGAGQDVYTGVNYGLVSGAENFVPSTIYAYMTGNKKLVLAGTRESLTLTFEIGNPVIMEFGGLSLSYGESYTAIGYTPNLQTTPNPPVCLGLVFDMFFEAEVVTGSTNTLVIVTATPDLEIAIGDYLIADVTGNYQTSQITNVTGTGDKTVTVSLSGSPTIGSTAYIKRSAPPGCIRTFTASLEPENIPTDCMVADQGKSSYLVADRMINLSWDNYFASWYDLQARDNVVSTEFWVFVGSADGNRILFNFPYVYRTEFGVSAGDKLMGQTNSGYAAKAAGNDGMFFCKF